MDRSRTQGGRKSHKQHRFPGLAGGLIVSYPDHGRCRTGRATPVEKALGNHWCKTPQKLTFPNEPRKGGAFYANTQLSRGPNSAENEEQWELEALGPSLNDTTHTQPTRLPRCKHSSSTSCLVRSKWKEEGGVRQRL